MIETDSKCNLISNPFSNQDILSGPLSPDRDHSETYDPPYPVPPPKGASYNILRPRLNREEGEYWSLLCFENGCPTPD